MPTVGRGSVGRGSTIGADVRVISELAPRQYGITESQSETLIASVLAVFMHTCRSAGVDESALTAIKRKFCDAGRRSAPWRPTSSVVPGRPQDGSDGNRINRWLLPADHKFYASQVQATLVEIKYFLQALSMEGAPVSAETSIFSLFHPWLIEHPVIPGVYVDPIQLIPISFNEFSEDRRIVQSGHLHPLDRGGKHHPSNTFLMLARSNQLQGNLTVAELLELMDSIVIRHSRRREGGDALESIIQQHR